MGWNFLALLRFALFYFPAKYRKKIHTRCVYVDLMTKLNLYMRIIFSLSGLSLMLGLWVYSKLKHYSKLINSIIKLFLFTETKTSFCWFKCLVWSARSWYVPASLDFEFVFLTLLILLFLLFNFIDCFVLRLLRQLSCFEYSICWFCTPKAIRWLRVKFQSAPLTKYMSTCCLNWLLILLFANRTH